MEESKVQSAVRTRLPPCAVRILYNRFVLVGTYDLDKTTGNRTGSIDVFNEQLQLLRSYNTYGAILDLKVSPFEHDLIATAHSTGNVGLWKFMCVSESDDSIELTLIANLQVFDTETLITSLHFSPLDATLLGVTGTSGEAVTLDISLGRPSRKVTVQGGLRDVVENHGSVLSKAHQLECWTAEFAQLPPLQDVLFTGGDDSTIMAHDIRSKDCIWSNNRIHEAGVVAIKCSTSTFRVRQPTSIITGSYDDYIRDLEFRMLGQSIYPGQNVPVAKKLERNLGGGVWRFSECPFESRGSFSSDTLLACCMYNGAAVVKIGSNDPEYFQVVNHLKKGHESMCYGGDWCSDFVATCSFYDKSLQTWNH
ncbi:probable Diphthamide biosynthesis protein RRT2 [Zygosaccharomyces bailii]|uniref:methylated diphthine methylhydrolase n=1 Tax=Zygosaccharomyces bailii (strain CLIB 213 / ATCC 58445 / CBS 680 / BCRC 21525 / NBRC 1098 / NCYC 1416 / NRRL Y-2227) TaxID=1333698 RepID=A0A8J2T6B5_ZYGB2|nr:ZYBA0S03-04808g1_1 [Zygosaccharomyces bailii CLIB 213]CDH15998.1 probable Diphthamide biosynthesis protein RRT2 [Zygosaccharomyces bailii ISA1307]SJM82999.1 probable Diphthamide biosynthesis protein RRT2 [Zygosaccharomyces bailii]